MAALGLFADPCQEALVEERLLGNYQSGEVCGHRDAAAGRGCWGVGITDE